MITGGASSETLMPVEVLSALLDNSKLSNLESRPNSELPGEISLLIGFLAYYSNYQTYLLILIEDVIGKSHV